MIRISAIYMASGFGKRFGRNKLLEEVGGKKLYLYGLERLMEWQESVAHNNRKELQLNREELQLNREELQFNRKEPQFKVNIVVVSQYQEILRAGKAMGLICVENGQAAEGITASIRLGLGAAGEADYYLFSVADQPWLKRSTMDAFVRKFLEVSEEYSIGCLSAKKGGGGNPVIFHRRYREELLALQGDQGGGQVMRRYPEQIFYFLTDMGQLKDIDQPSDLP